jgi:hypothetical protein
MRFPSSCPGTANLHTSLGATSLGADVCRSIGGYDLLSARRWRTAVQLGIGAGFGAVFALLARVPWLRGPVLLAGAGCGLAVMTLMGLVALPGAAKEGNR